MRRNQHFQQFRPHPLGRQVPQALALTDAGRKPIGIERQPAKIRGKPEKPQDAQKILADAGNRIANEAHAPGFNVWKAMDGIKQRAIARAIECVDGEIPSPGVRRPIVREGNARPPPIGLYVAAKCRDLIGLRSGNNRHRSVRDSRRDRPEASPRRRRLDLPRFRGRRDVHVGDRQAHQRIPHRAANYAGLETSGCQGGKNELGFGARKPSGFRMTEPCELFQIRHGAQHLQFQPDRSARVPYSAA